MKTYDLASTKKHLIVQSPLQQGLKHLQQKKGIRKGCNLIVQSPLQQGLKLKPERIDQFKTTSLSYKVHYNKDWNKFDFEPTWNRSLLIVQSPLQQGLKLSESDKPSLKIWSYRTKSITTRIETNWMIITGIKTIVTYRTKSITTRIETCFHQCFYLL